MIISDYCAMLQEVETNQPPATSGNDLIKHRITSA
jgi:hypothetical protein